MATTMTERVEKVKLAMKKLNIPDTLKAQVKYILDDSGSAEWMYNNGMMQELTERAMAVGIRLDADGKLEVVSFSNTAHKHGDITEADIPGYIQNRFIPEAKVARTWLGGTDYHAAVVVAAEAPSNEAVSKLKSFATGLFRKKPVEPVYPNFNIFISDGRDDGSESDLIAALTAVQNTDYFMMVGVGNPDYFGRMQKVADLLPNVGFVHFNDLTISDDVMYARILTKEGLDWLLARQPQQ